jgi:hypothetical protein
MQCPIIGAQVRRKTWDVPVQTKTAGVLIREGIYAGVRGVNTSAPSVKQNLFAAVLSRHNFPGIRYATAGLLLLLNGQTAVENGRESSYCRS